MVSVCHQSTARAIRKLSTHLLSYRSRGTLMSYTDHSAQRRLKSNAPYDMHLPHNTNPSHRAYMHAKVNVCV